MTGNGKEPYEHGWGMNSQNYKSDGSGCCKERGVLSRETQTDDAK